MGLEDGTNLVQSAGRMAQELRKRPISGHLCRVCPWAPSLQKLNMRRTAWAS